MTNKRKYQIFISYSTKNKDIKDKIVQDLQEYGFDVWVDTENIPLTRNWTEEIRTGIKNAKILLYLGSPEAKKSTYVSYELGYADALNKIILPIRIKGRTWGECVPSWYSVTQGMELRGSQYEKRKIKLFESLRDLISKTVMEELKIQCLVNDTSNLKDLLIVVNNIVASDRSDYREQVLHQLSRAGASSNTEENINQLINILMEWNLVKLTDDDRYVYIFTTELTKLGKSICEIL